MAVANGAEVAVGVEVASEPQPAATKPRTRSREIHPALFIDEFPPEILVKDSYSPRHTRECLHWISHLG